MAWFNFKDGIYTVQRAQVIPTPSGMSAVPSGPLKRIYSVTKIAFDPGGKATTIKGAYMTPIAIAIGAAEPKLDIEVSNAFELADARRAMGGVGSTIVVAVNFVRQGMTPIGYLFLPSTWENGGGFDGDDANGFKDKLTVRPQDCFENGTSIYNKLA